MIYSYNNGYPQVSHDPLDISLLQPPYLGLDYEWDLKTETPTILGLSDGTHTISVPFDSGVHRFRDLLHQPERWTFVGHNFIRAERPILLRDGVSVPLERVGDTIIWHYLVNAHLCKAGGKSMGETGAELERRGPGFMNIWTMCSIHTSLPNWKFCREKECDNNPCPKHQPFWYNGIDALGPVLALPDLMRKAKILGVDKLYPLHLSLNEQFQKMHERGVWVNKAYIEDLRAKFRAEKDVLWKKDQEIPTPDSLPFNPESWQQAKKFFREKYDLVLKDTTEETVRDLVNEYSEVINPDEPDWNKLESKCKYPELADYLAYKEIGSGPDRWYANKEWDGSEWVGYVVDEGGGLGTIHPNINHFTSTGRTACANPNLQNVETRRIDRKTGEKIGKRMRKAVVAPPGYRLYSADWSNGENRAMLYFAGYDIPWDQDLHSWMVANIGLKDSDMFSLQMGGAREAAKSVTHAADYLEGLDLLTPAQLYSGYVQREIRAGARLVFKDWKFRDMIVSFTGGNLAMRAFHSKTWENRAAALGIAARYIDQTFPKLRDVQKMITKQVEEQGMVRVPHGYVLKSYDRTPEDMLKTAVAMWGSNPIAHYLKLAVLNAESHPRIIPAIPVHDEIVFYADAAYEPVQVKRWAEECMVFDTPEMPGFKMPIKVKTGPNWGEMVKIEG